MKTIILKFSGPMQSWGTHSHFETRHTDLYPSKSAVLGLVAASFGYRRDETDKIKELNKLDFAVRVDQAGSLLRDYHTAEKIKEKTGKFERTYVTERYYLEDAIFLVALAHEDDRWINEIYEALKNPYFQPFMGRRSLPVPLDFILKVTDEDPIFALSDMEWQGSAWYRKKYSDKLDAYADSHLLDSHRISLRRDQVEAFDQKNRQFNYREESHFFITPPSERSKIEHDAFKAVKGG